MRVENLQYVLEVARAGSISAAAKIMDRPNHTLGRHSGSGKELDIQLSCALPAASHPRPWKKRSASLNGS